MANILSKVGNALKTAATKVAEVVKAAAPAALTIMGKSGIVPGGALIQTVASSLLNKTNAPKASPAANETAKQAIIDHPAIGQMQMAGAAVKSINGEVSVPLNSLGIGQMNHVVPIVTAVSSGHIITANGSVVQTLPKRDLAVAASSIQALPTTDPLKKIQEVVNVLNEQNPPAATNKPAGSQSQTEMPQWLKVVLIVTGVGLILFVVVKLFSRKR